MSELEKLKKERTVQRRFFTNSANEFEAMLENAVNVDTHVARANLLELSENLMSLDKEIKSLILREEEFESNLEKEMNETTKYKTKWRRLDAMYLEKSKSSTTAGPSSSNEKNRNILLPKIKFTIFDGDLKGWLPFWGQFQKIHDDTCLDNVDKYQYLVQSMKEDSEVRALVESYPPNSYNECMEQLKTRYAREELLIQVYVRELLALVLMRKQNVTITQLYDKPNAQLRALESLGVTKDKYAAFLLPMVESALTQDLLRTWERCKIASKDITEELANLLSFLKREVDGEQRIEISRKTFEQDTETEEKKEKLLTTEVLLTNSKDIKKITCVWCDKENHSSIECYKLQKLKLEDRRNIIKEKKICPICLRRGHHAKQCKAFVKCLICQRRHSIVLCPEQKNDDAKEKKAVGDQSTSLSAVQPKAQTLLQTLVVEIQHQDKKMRVRALCDSGSQRTYVKKDIVEKLNIPSSGKERLTHCLFGGVKSTAKEFSVYNLKVNSLDNQFSMELGAVAQERICTNLPKISTNDEKLNKLLNEYQITLTDVGNDETDIGLLIGADFLGYLFTGTMIQLQNGLVAIKTKIGWTLQGKVVSTNCSIMTVLHCACQVDLSDFWAMETLGISDPVQVKTKAETTADMMQRFEENIKRVDDRYEVKLPFKSNCEDLLPNYIKAKQRLESMNKKLIQSQNLQKYDAVFDTWLKLGIIERTDNDPNSGHYLPHRPVFKEQSLTCSVRPVFDASATDRNGLSLNACLEKGSNLIELIPDLILGFRTKAIGLTADIEKAFLQISIAPEHRDYLKFLWYKDDNLITYRHCRVVFGLTSSPFLLAATILHHLNEIKGGHIMTETAELLSRSYYVDNCVVSLDIMAEADKFMKEAKSIMNTGKFNLRMWVTSHGLNETGNDVVSVLGVSWDTRTDELYCNLSSLPSPDCVQKLTVRELLSIAHKIFDPIGYSSPVMLIPRLLLREAWDKQLTWDDELPVQLLSKFHDWYKYITYLQDCRVPRRLTADTLKECKLSLHLFCDASKDGCGACVLLRAENKGKVTVQIVQAKSRVTPLKKATIPRLELTAALIGSRLLTYVRKTLQLQDCDEYCWIDSGVTLSWIKRELPLKTFVGNRVKEIRQNSNLTHWYHIPGELNWADLASRGCNAKTLHDCRWWEGPRWLYLPREEWPRSELTVDEREIYLETKKTVCNIVSVETSLLESLQSYFSKYSKLIRMTAWLLRFLHNTRHVNNKNKGEITFKEYEKAEKQIIKLIQTKNSDNILKRKNNLTTYEDSEGLIRVKTKLLLSDFPESIRTPYLLPAKERIVMMMVRQRHVQLQHAGANQLITDIRSRFWIIGIRRLVRSVIHSCTVCARYRAKPTQAPTAPLPPERVTCSVPFQTTGVDLAGPLYLREGEKCWIVIYTCAVYRAVHLETTKSLSTEAFMNTLRRFIARRGRVSTIMSDQGTNFQGTKNLLSSLDWEEIQRESTVKRISWKMNAPLAAWWGGYWERLIRIMKDLLRRIIGKTSVTYDELQTIVCDCEATMNGRPLTFVNDDKGEYLEPLTPQCFIQPISNSDVTDLDLIDAMSLNSRHKYLQTLREQFRQRFKSEYLTFLVQKGKEKSDKIEVGDIVLIETNEKRIKWPLGIIEQLISGKDGVQRTAKVKTSTGVRVRPVQRLFRLEIPDNSFKIGVPDANCAIADGNTDSLSPHHDKVQSTRSGRKVKLPSKFSLYV